MSIEQRISASGVNFNQPVIDIFGGLVTEDNAFPVESDELIPTQSVVKAIAADSVSGVTAGNGPIHVLSKPSATTTPDDALIQSWLDKTDGMHYPADGVYYIATPHKISVRSWFKLIKNPNAIFLLHNNFSTTTVGFVFDVSGIEFVDVWFNARGNLTSNQSLVNFNNEAYWVYTNDYGKLDIGGIYTNMPKASVYAIGSGGDFTAKDMHGKDCWNYHIWTSGASSTNILKCAANGLGLTAQNTGNDLGDTPLVLLHNSQRDNVDRLWLQNSRNTLIKADQPKHVTYNNIHCKDAGKDPIKAHISTGTNEIEHVSITNCTSTYMRPWASTNDGSGHILVEKSKYTYVNNFKVLGGLKGGINGSEHGVFINNAALTEPGYVDISGVEARELAECGIQMYNVTGKVHDNTIKNALLDPSINGSASITANGCKGLKVYRNDISHDVRPTVNDSFGIYIAGSDFTIEDNITDNTNNIGIYPKPTADSKEIMVRRNTEYNAGAQGLYSRAEGTPVTVDVFNIENNIVDGNVSIFTPMELYLENLTINELRITETVIRSPREGAFLYIWDKASNANGSIGTLYYNNKVIKAPTTKDILIGATAQPNVANIIELGAEVGTVETSIIENSDKAVSGGAVFDGLETKLTKLTSVENNKVHVVNSDGSVRLEDLPILTGVPASQGPELLSNGNLDGGLTDWSANEVSVVSGRFHFDIPATGSARSVYQAIPSIEEGKSYHVEYEIEDGANAIGTQVIFREQNVGGGTVHEHTISAGVETVSFDFTATSIGTGFFLTRATGATANGHDYFIDNLTMTENIPATEGVTADSLSEITLSSATDNGTQGQIRYDSEYIYLCVAGNTWKRAALSTW